MANAQFNYIESAVRTINTEANELISLASRIDESFSLAAQKLLETRGKIVVTGMGKSGHIAKKIAATLASTGSPAFFVHPGEASHGDMGMITGQDIVIAISNSGASGEVVSLLPLLKRLKSPIIAMTGKRSSALAEAADVHLDISVQQEACPLDLAPTSSTTVTLALGDALAIALLEARGFTPEDFALSHPGGALGKRLILKVRDVMHGGNSIPVVELDSTLSDALIEMNSKGLGMTTVQTNEGLKGIFTDGDLRRSLNTTSSDQILTTPIRDLMTKNPKSVSSEMLAVEALNIMEQSSITSLVVLNGNDVEGIIHLHDILQAGVA